MTKYHPSFLKFQIRKPTSQTFTLRVRYAETDQAGMAHHSVFLPWFEVGRVELLRALGKPYQEIGRAHV